LTRIPIEEAPTFLDRNSCEESAATSPSNKWFSGPCPSCEHPLSHDPSRIGIRILMFMVLEYCNIPKKCIKKIKVRRFTHSDFPDVVISYFSMMEYVP
jgi:hypothetical protein